MPKKMKNNYLISLIAVAIGFLLLCLLFDTGILGKKSAYFNGLVVIGMFYTIIVCSLNLLTGYTVRLSKSSSPTLLFTRVILLMS